jgi:hypothetical protein
MRVRVRMSVRHLRDEEIDEDDEDEEEVAPEEERRDDRSRQLLAYVVAHMDTLVVLAKHAPKGHVEG